MFIVFIKGYWPNGEKVYVEHMSHHPPISRFYILGNDYKFYGSINQIYKQIAKKFYENLYSYFQEITEL